MITHYSTEPLARSSTHDEGGNDERLNRSNYTPILVYSVLMPISRPQGLQGIHVFPGSYHFLQTCAMEDCFDLHHGKVSICSPQFNYSCRTWLLHSRSETMRTIRRVVIGDRLPPCPRGYACQKPSGQYKVLWERVWQRAHS